MRLHKLLLTASLGIASLPALANDFDDYARVVRVTPQVEQINMPRQECWTEQASMPAPAPQRGVGGSIVGGVVGGLLGSQVGGGNGRIAAAAVGAMTGAVVGDRIENSQVQHHPGYVTQPVQRCRMVDHWETRNNGYAVTYEYRGNTQTTSMPYHPGERIRVRVSVQPQI